jgi:hypothetical protein
VALRPRLSPGVLFRGGFFRPGLPYGVAGTASISATASTHLGLRRLNRSTRPTCAERRIARFRVLDRRIRNHGADRPRLKRGR